MTTENTEEVKAQPKSRIDILEETVLALIDKFEELEKKLGQVEKSAVKKSTGLFGGKREKTAILDTTTKKVYPSKAAVGKALYGEIEGGDPGDHFVWYKLQSKFPERFVNATAEQAEKVWADEKAKQEKEVAEANKKLEAEAVEKAKVEAADKLAAEKAAKK